MSTIITKKQFNNHIYKTEIARRFIGYHTLSDDV